MTTEWQIDCLKARINSVINEIKRVAEKDHPYPEPDIIYKALISVITEREEFFNDTLSLFGESDPQTVSEIFGSLVLDLQRITEIFTLADRVDSARIPFEILRSLSWVASSIINEDCKSVVRLDTVYTYSIISCRRKFSELGWEDHWDNAAVKYKKTDVETPFTVLILGFPSPEAGSILVHALAAHEFGHEVAFDNLTKIREIASNCLIDIQQKYQEDLQEIITDKAYLNPKIPVRDSVHNIHLYITGALLKITANWLQEIFSDLFAATLVGPAFLAAFERIQLQFDDSSPTHPPGYLRKKLVRDYLNQISPQIVEDPVWEPLFDGLHGHVKKEQNLETNSDITIENNPSYINTIVDSSNYTKSLGDFEKGHDPFAGLYPFIEYACNENGSKLWEILSTMHSPLSDSKEVFKKVNEMERYISNLAPPSVALNIEGDKNDFENFWLLMYAGWHFRLNKEKFNLFNEKYGFEEKENRAEDVLGNLILHSLQAIELRYQWESKN